MRAIVKNKDGDVIKELENVGIIQHGMIYGNACGAYEYIDLWTNSRCPELTVNLDVGESVVLIK